MNGRRDTKITGLLPLEDQVHTWPRRIIGIRRNTLGVGVEKGTPQPQLGGQGRRSTHRRHSVDETSDCATHAIRATHERVSNAGSIRKRRYANSGLSFVWYVTHNQVTLITSSLGSGAHYHGREKLRRGKARSFHTRHSTIYLVYSYP